MKAFSQSAKIVSLLRKGRSSRVLLCMVAFSIPQGQHVQPTEMTFQMSQWLKTKVHKLRHIITCNIEKAKHMVMAIMMTNVKTLLNLMSVNKSLWVGHYKKVLGQCQYEIT